MTPEFLYQRRLDRIYCSLTTSHRYSRRIIWLEVCTTNNNPAVIAYYYLKSINLLQGNYNCIILLTGDALVTYNIGLPSIVRADLGTENTTIAWIQPFLRRHGLDSACNMSFRYGHSVSNQVYRALNYCAVMVTVNNRG